MATAANRKSLLKVKESLEAFANSSGYYEMLIAQYHYCHPQLLVHHDEKKGRGLKAAKDIPAGTILLSNPSGHRVDLPTGMTQRNGNISLGLSLFQKITKFGFDLDALAIANDTLAHNDDVSQPDFGVGTRGANAKTEYPLREVFPIVPECLGPDLTALPKYPNPFLFINEKGETQHIPLTVNPQLPVELRDNLINAMRDQKKGYQLLTRAVLMVQENSVLTPHNIPFLLPHMFIKPRPLEPKTSKDVKKKAAPAKKSTPKVIAGRKGTSLTLAAKTDATKKSTADNTANDTVEDEDEEEKKRPITYNFFQQLSEDNGSVENIPATFLRQCKQLIADEDADEDEDDEEEEPQTAQQKIQQKSKRGKEEEEEEEDESVESLDSMVVFPSFALINHDCSPNTSPLFFHIPNDEYLTKLYKEHRQAIEAAKKASPEGPVDVLEFQLPRHASVASCAVVVALRDIKAGEELSINYTPLAHCETSPHLLNETQPIIQYIPWMQEFRQSQMQRVHNMLCDCTTCQTDLVIQKAVNAQNAVVSRLEQTNKVDKESQEAKEADFEKTMDNQKPLEPFTKLDDAVKDDLFAQDINTVAQRLLLHTVVLSDKQSEFNKNMVPLLLFHNRNDGTQKQGKDRGSPKNPEAMLQRLHSLTEHPLWKGIFASRGGWEKVNTSTQFLSVHELFGSSQALLKQIGDAVLKGRQDQSAVVPKEANDADLQKADLIPIIIPSGFQAANTIISEGSAPAAIIPSDNATLIPTIASLDVTSSLSASVGIYAAVSAAFERITTQGLPNPTPEEKEQFQAQAAAATSGNHPETDLLEDGAAAPAGTQAEQKEKQQNVKTKQLINASDGTVIEPDEDLVRLIRESRTYSEMTQMLEAIMCEVLGLNESEGRKEYILPTHWFVASLLGVLHPMYIKLGAHTEALLASLFLTMITGLSVPLSNIQPQDARKLEPRGTKDMADAKKINKFFVFSQAQNPLPGSTVVPLHPSLVSLFIYFSDSLEQILMDTEIVIQYSKYTVNLIQHKEEKTPEDEAEIKRLTAEFEFANKFNSAIWFLGSSIEGYIGQ